MSARVPQVLASNIIADFHRDGFVILPAFLAPEELAAAVFELPTEFPTADEFHASVDPERNRRFQDEFGGITPFPLRSRALNLLSVHPRLISLAAGLLGDDDLRCYSIEFWAKYTGAVDYGQPLHRDYLNHSVLVPSAEAPASQVELFLYLTHVTDGHGPIALLPRQFTRGAPALPNWYPPVGGHRDEEHPEWVSADGRPDWYEHEVRATGPAGTVIAYRIDTFHRGTNLVAEGGSQFTIHTSVRRAADDWIAKRAWTDLANQGSAWADFVAAASREQLQLFGFPPPGHVYWTDDTLDGMARRYPGFNRELWR